MTDESRRKNPSVRASAAAELCRLTILAEHTQVDLAVPNGVPLAILIPGIVDTIRSHRSANDFDDAVEQYEPSEWVLAKIGQSPLSSTLSLHEHGIRDGDLLVLESVEETAPPPLFDDIMYTVAGTGAEGDREWSPDSARLVGSVAALSLITIGCLTLLWAEAGSGNYISSSLALVLSILFLIGGALTSRIYHDTATSLVLSGAAMPLAFTAGVLLVPGAVDAPHLLVGSSLTAVAAILALRVSGVGLATFTAISTTGLFLIVGSLVGTVTDIGYHAIAAVTVAAALILLSQSARISILLGKLPLPPVPAPGTSVDPAEDDPDDRRTMPPFEVLARRSTRARSYLTGLIAASTVLTVSSAIVAALPNEDGGIYWPGTALALVASALLMFRGRTYSSVSQAIPLVSGGILLLVLLLATGAVAVPGLALVLFVVAIVLAVAALVFGIIFPQQAFSPVMRRAGEILELAIIASVIPLVCWVTDLYSTMRGL
ncbi:MAG: type VII secretion integral membrane protein EccD [Rhodococcus sp.]|nr:type VII secretion integral membrane protein EccD [Rhodococcus sp. (in: high G+C Gram-positive bacteria)]